MILSVLICSLEKRAYMLQMLTTYLQEQIVRCDAKDKVQVLTKVDNGQKTTGMKRNELLEEATGTYSVFCDDDDWIADYYIEELLKAAESDCDCFAINGTMTTNGHSERRWWIYKDSDYSDRPDGYHRYPNHLCPMKREIAIQFKFPQITIGEDYEWATAIHNAGIIKTEYKIEKPMYHYRFTSKT